MLTETMMMGTGQAVKSMNWIDHGQMQAENYHFDNICENGPTSGGNCPRVSAKS